MDSLTQIALGATVGGCVASAAKPGEFKVVRRAILVGMGAGFFPDLDVLSSLLLKDVESFTSHRGLTHSLLTAPLWSWLLHWLWQRTPWKEGLSAQRWYLLFLLCVLTHILLDLCTVYGTQIFYPLSRYPYALSSLFIIDPLYTLPLLIALALTLWPGRSRSHLPRRAGVLLTIGLVVSTAYASAGLAGKWIARQAFAEELARQGLGSRELLVANTPMNILLWKGLARTGSGWQIGYFSLLSPTESIKFKEQPFSRLRPAFNSAAKDRPLLAELKRFSKGFFAVESRGDEAIDFIDLRMGTEAYSAFRFEVGEINGEDEIQWRDDPPQIHDYPANATPANLLREFGLLLRTHL